MGAHLNSAELVVLGKLSCRNKLTHFFQKMGKKTTDFISAIIAPIINNFAEFNFAENRNKMYSNLTCPHL